MHDDRPATIFLRTKPIVQRIRSRGLSRRGTLIVRPIRDRPDIHKTHRRLIPIMFATIGGTTRAIVNTTRTNEAQDYNARIKDRLYRFRVSVCARWIQTKKDDTTTNTPVTNTQWVNIQQITTQNTVNQKHLLNTTIDTGCFNSLQLILKLKVAIRLEDDGDLSRNGSHFILEGRNLRH